MKKFLFFEHKKILFTGGNGYVASNVISLLRNVPCTIIRFDRTGTDWNDLNPGPKTGIINIEGDIRDDGIWDSLLDDIEVIFHLAAQTSVNVAAKNPMSDLEINVLPMLRMLEKCRGKKIKPIIIYAGTVTETGLTPELPVKESQPDRPITIYDIHKLSAENYLKYYAKERIVSGAILRLSNAYGPGPKSSQADRGILNMMIGKAIKGEDLTVYGDGKFIRDYVYIEDVAMAFLTAAERIETLNGEHFLIGSGVGQTLQEAFTMVANRVAGKQSKRVKVMNIDPPAGLPEIEKRDFIADISKFSTLTNWFPQTGLADGIDRTIDWYLKTEKKN